MELFRRRVGISPAMVVALLALVLALGGTSYAVVRLPARSVASKHLRNGAVTRAKIKANAIDTTKVADGALTGADIAEGSLAAVPNAQNALNAQNAARAASAAAADHATAAGSLDQVAYRVVRVTVAVAPSIDVAAIASGTAACDAGRRVVGGGVKVDDLDKTAIIDSFPDAAGTSWTARVDSTDLAATHDFTVYAICVAAGAAG